MLLAEFLGVSAMGTSTQIGVGASIGRATGMVHLGGTGVLGAGVWGTHCCLGGWSTGRWVGAGFSPLKVLVAPCALHERHPHTAKDVRAGVQGYRVRCFPPRVGGRVPWLGHRVVVEGRVQRLHRQLAELMGIWHVMSLALHLGWKAVSVFSDNAGARDGSIRCRASMGLWVQQWILRKKIVPVSPPLVSALCLGASPFASCGSPLSFGGALHGGPVGELVCGGEYTPMDLPALSFVVPLAWKAPV